MGRNVDAAVVLRDGRSHFTDWSVPADGALLASSGIAIMESETEQTMIDPLIRGAARDVRFGDLGQVRHQTELVLLATDGSEPAVYATQHAVLLAKLLGARMKVLYVDTGLEELELPDNPVTEDRFERLDPALKGIALALRLAETNEVECTAEIVKGGVASNIIGAARRDGAGVIVLGDTGRTGLRRIALGSVAEAVVKASEIPVLVTKAV